MMKQNFETDFTNTRATILGSTGSIGTQTLDVCRFHKIPVCAIAGSSSIGKLEEQIREFHPTICGVADETAAADLKLRVADTNTKVLSGADGINACAAYPESTVVLNSIMGTAGLMPTLTAIAAGKSIALSNKETLVTAGEYVMRAAREKGVRILPVDSEHCAIYQCLRNENHGRIKKLILTCSGGPFFGRDSASLNHVSIAETLAHPTWKMGAKITVDCATLMNKGLELIEAVRLFDVSPDMVDVVIHRESIIHSMVEYIDNAVIAQMSMPDMRLCIQYALTCPDRLQTPIEPLNLAKIGHLSFYEPDETTFSLLPLARRAVKDGGTKTATLNGANEAAVDLFIRGKISLCEIFSLVETVVDGTDTVVNPSLEEICAADRAARNAVYREAADTERITDE